MAVRALRSALAVACLLVVVAMPVSAQTKAEPRPQSEYPVATDARIEQAGETVRLTMTLSSSVAVDAWVQAGPDRIIVELPSTNFQIQPAARPVS